MNDAATPMLLWSPSYFTAIITMVLLVFAILVPIVSRKKGKEVFRIKKRSKRISNTLIILGAIMTMIVSLPHANAYCGQFPTTFIAFGWTGIFSSAVAMFMFFILGTSDDDEVEYCLAIEYLVSGDGNYFIRILTPLILLISVALCLYLVSNPA